MYYAGIALEAVHQQRKVYRRSAEAKRLLLNGSVTSAQNYWSSALSSNKLTQYYRRLLSRGNTMWRQK